MSENTRQIVQYIRENRHTYTQEAINKQLLDMGHAPEDIFAAWASVQVSEEAYGSVPRGQSVVGKPLFWVVLIGFVVLSYGVPALFGAFLANGTSAPLVLFFVIAIAGLIAGFTYRDYNRPLGMGLLVGVLIAIVLPTIGFALFLGICISQYLF